MSSAHYSPAARRGPADVTITTNARTERMTTLLRRYPEIAEEERLELLEFLTNGSQEEIVQVAHLQGIEPRFLQFRSDHPKEFRTGFRGWLPMILFIVVAVIGIVWRMSL